MRLLLIWKAHKGARAWCLEVWPLPEQPYLGKDLCESCSGTAIQTYHSWIPDPGTLGSSVWGFVFFGMTLPWLDLLWMLLGLYHTNSSLMWKELNKRPLGCDLDDDYFIHRKINLENNVKVYEFDRRRKNTNRWNRLQLVHLRISVAWAVCFVLFVIAIYK